MPVYVALDFESVHDPRDARDEIATEIGICVVDTDAPTLSEALSFCYVAFIRPDSDETRSILRAAADKADSNVCGICPSMHMPGVADEVSVPVPQAVTPQEALSELRSAARSGTLVAKGAGMERRIVADWLGVEASELAEKGSQLHIADVTDLPREESVAATVIYYLLQERCAPSGCPFHSRMDPAFHCALGDCISLCSGLFYARREGLPRWSAKHATRRMAMHMPLPAHISLEWAEKSVEDLECPNDPSSTAMSLATRAFSRCHVKGSGVILATRLADGGGLVLRDGSALLLAEGSDPGSYSASECAIEGLEGDATELLSTVEDVYVVADCLLVGKVVDTTLRLQKAAEPPFTPSSYAAFANSLFAWNAEEPTPLYRLSSGVWSPVRVSAVPTEPGKIVAFASRVFFAGEREFVCLASLSTRAAVSPTVSLPLQDPVLKVWNGTCLLVIGSCCQEVAVKKGGSVRARVVTDDGDIGVPVVVGRKHEFVVLCGDEIKAEMAERRPPIVLPRLCRPQSFLEDGATTYISCSGRGLRAGKRIERLLHSVGFVRYEGAVRAVWTRGTSVFVGDPDHSDVVLKLQKEKSDRLISVTAVQDVLYLLYENGILDRYDAGVHTALDVPRGAFALVPGPTLRVAVREDHHMRIATLRGSWEFGLPSSYVSGVFTENAFYGQGLCAGICDNDMGPLTVTDPLQVFFASRPFLRPCRGRSRPLSFAHVAPSDSRLFWHCMVAVRGGHLLLGGSRPSAGQMAYLVRGGECEELDWGENGPQRLSAAVGGNVPGIGAVVTACFHSRGTWRVDVDFSSKKLVWEALQPFPEAKWNCLAAVHENALVVFGGWTGTSVSRSVHVFDGEWHTLPSLPTSPLPSGRNNNNGAFVSVLNHVVLIGGAPDSPTEDAVWTFSVKERRWASLGIALDELCSARGSLKAVTCHGEVLIFGDQGYGRLRNGSLEVLGRKPVVPVMGPDAGGWQVLPIVEPYDGGDLVTFVGG